MSSKIKKLIDVIKSQEDALNYSNIKFTLLQKRCIYKAFYNLVERNPNEMYGYILNSKRGVSALSKVFQEYVNVLDKNLRSFTFEKYGEKYKIDSLLDKRLSLFSGMTKFSASVLDHGIIKNMTQDPYVSERSLKCEPYFIGKILDIVDRSNNEPVLKKVKEYSFSEIKTSLPTNTQVVVTHLMIPPHYQMGALSHINRIRKNIVEGYR